MIINKNNPEYSNEIHELIWNLSTNRVPLEVTLPMVPEDLREPCTNLYNFMTVLLDDMHQDAEEYDIIDKNDVWFYIRHFFEWMYKKFRFVDNAFVASKDEYRKFVSRFNPKHVEIMLARHGFEFDDDGKNVCIANNRYTGMMKAVAELLEAAYHNYSVNCTDYLTTCDFRALVNYRRTYADMFLLLNDADKAIAEQLHDYAARRRIKPVKCTYFCRVEYKKKGKMIFILDVVSQKNLKINIGFAEISGEAFKMIEKEVEKYNDMVEFTDFWHKNLKRCTSCRQECWKRSNPIEVFGKKTLVCQSYIRIYDPKEEDLEHIFRLIDLRAMVVDAGISEVFYPGNG